MADLPGGVFVGVIADVEAVGGLFAGLVAAFAVARLWGLVRDFVTGPAGVD